MKLLIQISLIVALHISPTMAWLYWAYLGITFIWVLHNIKMMQNPELTPVYEALKKDDSMAFLGWDVKALTVRVYTTECLIDVAVCAWLMSKLF
jgi:hypothetical protein